RRSELPGMPTGADPLAHIAVLTPVLREICGKPLLVALVVPPGLSRMLGGMSLTPAPHCLASFLRVAFDPVAPVLASTFGVLIWHVADLAARGPRGNRTGEQAIGDLDGNGRHHRAHAGKVERDRRPWLVGASREDQLPDRI